MRVLPLYNNILHFSISQKVYHQHDTFYTAALKSQAEQLRSGQRCYTVFSEALLAASVFCNFCTKTRIFTCNIMHLILVILLKSQPTVLSEALLAAHRLTLPPLIQQPVVVGWPTNNTGQHFLPCIVG